MIRDGRNWRDVAFMGPRGHLESADSRFTFLVDFHLLRLPQMRLCGQEVEQVKSDRTSYVWNFHFQVQTKPK